MDYNVIIVRLHERWMLSIKSEWFASFKITYITHLSVDVMNDKSANLKRITQRNVKVKKVFANKVHECMLLW